MKDPPISSVFVLEPTRPEAQILAELDAACLVEGVLQVMPSAFYRAWPQADLCLWCVRRGFYCLPTVELVERARQFIAGRKAIEIGAGHGALGRALGIPRTDNKMQTWPEIRALYANMQQAVIEYPRDVEQLTALEAVERYQPEVVVAAWVTHRYTWSLPEAGGNAFGVDERALLDHPSVRAYFFVGNTYTHRNKPLLRHRGYTEEVPDYLFSRSPHRTDVIWLWGKDD